MSSKDKITAHYRPIKDISVADCLAMYNLFVQYYDNTPLDVFVRDMSRKTGAFMVMRERDNAIVGFSTLTNFDVMVDGKSEACYFSGDTVVDRPYWGNTALRFACFRHIMYKRIRYPLRNLNWFLISKGYRTYMVMANLFPNYYPAIEGEHTRLKKVTAAASTHLFPDYFDKERMVIRFGDDSCKLKSDVTPITAMERGHPKIAFFEKMNPGWVDGDELPCMAAVDSTLITTMLMDALKRMVGIGAKKRAAAHRAHNSGLADTASAQREADQGEEGLRQAR